MSRKNDYDLILPQWIMYLTTNKQKTNKQQQNQKQYQAYKVSNQVLGQGKSRDYQTNRSNFHFPCFSFRSWN